MAHVCEERALGLIRGLSVVPSFDQFGGPFFQIRAVLFHFFTLSELKLIEISRNPAISDMDQEQLRARQDRHCAEIVGQGFNDGILTMLRSQPQVQSVELENGRLFIDLNENARMSGLVPLLVQAGVEIEEIRKEQVSFEDVFLNLVEEDGK